MGSIGQTQLDFLRGRTQVDWDSLDLAGTLDMHRICRICLTSTGVADNHRYVDVTSNQVRPAPLQSSRRSAVDTLAD